MTVKDRMTLDLASRHYAYPAVRDRHVRDQLGMTPARFWQRVTWLLEQGDAEAAMPREVRRLRRLVEARRVSRARVRR